MTEKDLWQRARALFDEVVELGDAEKLSRLESIKDPSLRIAVENLLRSDSGSEEALEGYMFGSSRPSEPPVVSRDPLGIVGKTVSHFRVRDYLASGGMGAIYTAEDLQLGRTVALKFPLPDQQMDRAIKERFVNEARSAGALDHPNLCTVYEIGESEHGVFLAMPLYQGETLKARIARNGAIASAEAIGIAAQLTTGLVSAHAAGIVHRDLKPGNVMLLPGGAVKILDFGLAKIRDISLTRSHATLGTIGYVAPEQIRNSGVDARTDLWAIGVMLHEMLTGTQPFQGEHEVSLLHAILHEDPPAPSTLNANVPLDCDKLIAALLQKNPSDRHHSAEALLADLEALQQGLPMVYRPPFWSGSRARRRVRSAAVPLTAVVAILAVAGLIWNANRAVPASGPKFVDNTATVSTSSELIAALDPANSGRRVRMRAGTYEIDKPLVIPDGMTLEGEGVMEYTPDGMPSGFRDGSVTALRMTGNAGGDVLTLGDRVTLSRVEIADMTGRSGNVVAVTSRRANDRIAATIEESVITNPNPLTVNASASFGRALFVATRNLNMAADPAADTGSVIDVRLLRSLVRSPAGGGGYFAFNFAARSRISLQVAQSVIGGSSEANGGVSRPDAVHDSRVTIISERSVYRNELNPCAATPAGWSFTGGSPSPLTIVTQPSDRNTLVVRSVNDRIENFTTGVLAYGSRRFFEEPLNTGPRNNHIDLRLTGTTIITPSCPRSNATRGNGVAAITDPMDLRFIGSWVSNDNTSAGTNNTIRAELRGVTGSGTRSNRYADVAATTRFVSLSPQLQGTGNKLEVIGDLQTFRQTNRGIEPAPPANFFVSR